MRETAFRLCGTLLLLAVFLVSTSCGSKGTRVYAVKGKVFYQGKPTPGATVLFIPVGSNAGAVRPHATVEEDGTFQIGTYLLHDGAQPGRYDVTVVWTRPAHGDNEGETLIPLRYGDPATSELHVEVKAQANELPPFQLNP
jgi:hypothetical protein